MKCIVLAAGYATRLYPLTENFPKPLLEVKGKSILDCANVLLSVKRDNIMAWNGCMYPIHSMEALYFTCLLEYITILSISFLKW